MKTQSIQELMMSIRSLEAGRFEDAEVPILTAITCASDASQPSSPIFLFTSADSPISDKSLLGRVEALLEVNNMKLIIYDAFEMSAISKRSKSKRQFLSAKQRHRRQDNLDIFQELTTFSGGQVIDILSSDISEIGSSMAYFALQGSTSSTILDDKDACSLDSLAFPVDSYVFQILIIVTGMNINISVFNPQG